MWERTTKECGYENILGVVPHVRLNSGSVPTMALEMVQICERKDNLGKSARVTRRSNSGAAWQEDHGGVQGRVRAGGLQPEGHHHVFGNVVKLVNGHAVRRGSRDTPQRAVNEAMWQQHQQPGDRGHREMT